MLQCSKLTHKHRYTEQLTHPRTLAHTHTHAHSAVFTTCSSACSYAVVGVCNVPQTGNFYLFFLVFALIVCVALDWQHGVYGLLVAACNSAVWSWSKEWGSHTTWLSSPQVSLLVGLLFCWPRKLPLFMYEKYLMDSHSIACTAGQVLCHEIRDVPLLYGAPACCLAVFEP